jgi:hypothetical protein
LATWESPNRTTDQAPCRARARPVPRSESRSRACKLNCLTQVARVQNVLERLGRVLRAASPPRRDVRGFSRAGCPLRPRTRSPARTA